MIGDILLVLLGIGLGVAGHIVWSQAIDKLNILKLSYRTVVWIVSWIRDYIKSKKKEA